MAADGRLTFVNVPVASLDRSVGFFRGLGFEFDPRFTDETATCMIVSDRAYVMLLTRPKFAEFTQAPVAGPGDPTEVITAFSAESREEVDRLADVALATGGAPASPPIDMGFMYSRSFLDPDGHVWELVWMDMSQVPPA